MQGPKESMQLPELVAHRGHAAVCPENTIAAFRSAIEAGARWVETDVQISEDGVPFLFHDRSLERICSLKGPLSDRTELELESIAASYTERFGNAFVRERVAKLADFVTLLAANPQVRPFVELKRSSMERFGIEPVLERVLGALEPLGDRPVLISFSLDALAAARAKSKLALGAVFDRWDERGDPLMRDIQPDFVFFDVDGTPSSGSLALPGSRVAVYEVDDAKLALSLAARGVELVETFAIGTLSKALAERG